MGLDKYPGFEELTPWWRQEDYLMGYIPINEVCMIEEFFKQEAKKPAGMRATSCLISCPCKKCNPTSM